MLFRTPLYFGICPRRTPKDSMLILSQLSALAKGNNGKVVQKEQQGDGMQAGSISSCRPLRRAASGAVIQLDCTAAAKSALSAHCFCFSTACQPSVKHCGKAQKGRQPSLRKTVSEGKGIFTWSRSARWCRSHGTPYRWETRYPYAPHTRPAGWEQAHGQRPDRCWRSSSIPPRSGR